MKKNILILHIILFALLVTSCKSESKKIAERNAVIETTIRAFETSLLKNQIDSVFSKYNFNGIVAIYRDSTTLYKKTSGYSNFKTKENINDSTIFAIASNSKQFTAALILLQKEQGKLELSDKVSKYLKEFATPVYQNITIEELLNHTSGLNVMGQALRSKPGTEFHYSNDGYNALGKIVEKVSGKNYAENATELFQKAGLKHTYIDTEFTGGNFASAYIGVPENAQEVPNMPKRLSQNGIGTPAGGILSTVGDFHRWQQKLFDGEVLDSLSVQNMTQKTATRMDHFMGVFGYGGGLMLYGEESFAYFHTGYVKGAPSLTIYYPKTHTSVIILSNLANEIYGKKSIFKPHHEIKEITDGIQETVLQLRKDLIQ